MQKIKVSVIIPCHNGEEYISATLKSLMGQSLREIEIICVDDESTDSTFEILKAHEAEDQRIKAIRQKKSNAGAARNLGRKSASGEYLLFLDSDDMFEPDLLEKMYNACIKDGAQLCVCNADQYDAEKEKYLPKPQYLRKNLLPESRPFSQNDIGKYILQFTTSVPWNKMVKRSFLEEQQIDFQEIERANDQYFSIMCLILADSITVVDEALVHYKIRQRGNLTKTYSETPLSSYDAMLAVGDELARRNLLEIPQIRCAFDNKVLNVINYALNIQSDLDSFRCLYNKVKEEGFAKLGLAKQGEEYYFSPDEYGNYCRIMEYSCEEYLVVKQHDFYERIKRRDEVIREKTAIISKLRSEKKELKEKEKELKFIKSTTWFKIIDRLRYVYHSIFKPNRKK